MILGKILYCHRCGEPYEFMNMMVGDQSICPTCREKATAIIMARRHINQQQQETEDD